MMKSKKFFVILMSAILLFAVSSFAQANWTGDGGAGTSITILSPEATGLPRELEHIPALIQGEFVSNFAAFSAIRVTDWESLEEVALHMMSDMYSDSAHARINFGNLTPTTYLMTGRITRPQTGGYTLQVRITRTADNTIAASYTGTFSFQELDNLAGVRRASLELLQRLGVTLTANAQQQLTVAASQIHANRQREFANAITAQRGGNEVLASQHFDIAAALDPSNAYAVERSATLHTNISSGRMGDNIRDERAWRREWMERLRQTEELLNNFVNNESMPYTLFYVANDLRQHGQTNWRNETVTMAMGIHLHASEIWVVSMERTLQTVYDGLQATGKAAEWGFGNWPQQGVTNLNPLERRRDNFDITFELLNDQGRVIGRNTTRVGGSWELNRSRWRGNTRPSIGVSTTTNITFARDGSYLSTHITFQNISMDHISDHMTMRVATINGQPAEAVTLTGALQVRAITRDEFAQNVFWKYSRGTLLGTAQPQRVERGYIIGEIIIPETVWGDPVQVIANRAFKDIPIADITIPSNVRVGSEAFAGNSSIQSVTIGANVEIASNAFDTGFRGFINTYNRTGRLANTFKGFDFNFDEGILLGYAQRPQVRSGHHIPSLTIPDEIWGQTVIGIADSAFRDIPIREITIPNSVSYIGTDAFAGNNMLERISIGEQVEMSGNPFPVDRFSRFHINYEHGGKRAGVYEASLFNFDRGRINGFTSRVTRPQQGYHQAEIVIPDSIWGIPVTSIYSHAFRNFPTGLVTLPNSVREIGENAFVIVRSSRLPIINIGANVSMHPNSFTVLNQTTFARFYNRQKKQGGRYIFRDNRWRFFVGD